VNDYKELKGMEIGERLEYIFEAGHKVASLRSREIFNIFFHLILVSGLNIKKIGIYFIRIFCESVIKRLLFV
jgi:hypothetical protein